MTNNTYLVPYGQVRLGERKLTKSYSEKYTDIIIKLLEEQDRTNLIEMKLHRIILWRSSPFFAAMFTGFKESQEHQISIVVPNIFAAYDVIMGFYGEVTNSGNLPDWLHKLEMAKCQNYFGLKINTASILDLVVPATHYSHLIQVVEMIGYDKQTIELLGRNYQADVPPIFFPPNLNDLIQSTYLLALGRSGTIYIWDAYTGDMIQTYENKNVRIKATRGRGNKPSRREFVAINSLCIYPDHKYILYGAETLLGRIGFDRVVKQFNGSILTDTEVNIKLICHTPRPNRKSGEVWNVYDIASQTITIVDINNSISIRSPSRADYLHITHQCTGYDIYFICYLSLDSLLLVGEQGEVSVMNNIHDIDLTRTQTYHAYAHHRESNLHMTVRSAVSADLKLLAVGHENCNVINIIEITIDDIIASVQLPDAVGTTALSYVTLELLSGQIEYLLSGRTDGKITVWDTKTGKSVYDMIGHTHNVTNICFVPNTNRIASASYDHTIKIWDMDTRQVIRTLSVPDGFVTTLDYVIDRDENLRKIIEKLSGGS